MPLLCPAAVPERRKCKNRRDNSNSPAQCGAKRAGGAPEHQKIGIQWANCLTIGQVPGDVAPDQKTTEGHDKGRDCQKSDHPPLKGTNRRPNCETNDDGQDPGQRVIEPHAKHLGQDLCLNHCHHCRTGRQQGTDAQVDVACHDHKHHSRCHDGNRHGLNGQVKDVARRQKTPVRQDVESNTEDDKGTDHTQ
mmetsp:Transcript_17010/g.22360  ORF Transcript_17010/g.22360 Transcript_17010/m.22360 type:complete len:192 (-) Transcript_17010:1272-1847(-)